MIVGIISHCNVMPPPVIKVLTVIAAILPFKSIPSVSVVADQNHSTGMGSIQGELNRRIA